MKISAIILTVSIIFGAGLCQSVSAAGFDHSIFDRILKTYVNDQGLVDYNGIAGDQSFNSYMESLKTAQADSMSRDGQLAFWINAYNAVTIDKVIKWKPKKVCAKPSCPGFGPAPNFLPPGSTPWLASN
jgi:hypothetical protein